MQDLDGRALLDGPPWAWRNAFAAFAEARGYWLATSRRDGAPRVRPVLAVTASDAVHIAMSPRSAKASDVARDARVTLAASDGSADLAFEGVLERVTDATGLAEVAAAYAQKYDWIVEVRDGAFWAEGAPTAGEPPFHVHRLRVTAGAGFPTDGGRTATVWRSRVAVHAG